MSFKWLLQLMIDRDLRSSFACPVLVLKPALHQYIPSLIIICPFIIRLPQRAPPGADLLDLVDAIDSFAHGHTHAYESAPHAYGAGHQQAAYDDSYRQAAYDSVMESSCPPTTDEERSAVALMAVEVRQRQREDYGLKAPQSKDQRQEAERREEEKEEALHSTGYATREHGTREHGTREHGAKDFGTRDQRIRRRSLEAAPLPQHW